MADIDWDTQMALWGYVVLGEVTEPDALLVETDTPSTHAWDETLADLARIRLDRGRGWVTPPYWFALHHLPWSWREGAYAHYHGAQFDGDVDAG